LGFGLFRIRAGFRGRNFVGRFLRAMGRSSTPLPLPLSEHALEEARRRTAAVLATVATVAAAVLVARKEGLLPAI